MDGNKRNLSKLYKKIRKVLFTSKRIFVLRSTKSWSPDHSPKSPNMTTIQHLPTEVLEVILEHLPLEDQLTWLRVNQRWKVIAQIRVRTLCLTLGAQWVTRFGHRQIRTDNWIWPTTEAGLPIDPSKQIIHQRNVCVRRLFVKWSYSASRPWKPDYETVFNGIECMWWMPNVLSNFPNLASLHISDRITDGEVELVVKQLGKRLREFHYLLGETFDEKAVAEALVKNLSRNSIDQ